MEIQRINPTARWSDATLFAKIAHFVEVPEDTNLDFEQQIKQLLAQAEQTLAKLGSSPAHLLAATIYVTSRDFLPLLNQYWEHWLPEGAAPTRACVIVQLVDPAMLVEISFVAASVE